MTASTIWMSPDCREGKHRACTGDAWDLHADHLTDCDCDCHCQHESWTGDEGPIGELGRWPVRWRCDGCGEVRTDATPDASETEKAAEGATATHHPAPRQHRRSP